MNLFALIHSDYKKYRKYGGNFFGIVFFTQSFWAIFQFRIASCVYRKVKVQPIRAILLAITMLWQKLVEILTGISIPASVEIGHSFYIAHFSGVILNAQTKIGDNCNFSQGVTVGVSGIGEKRGVPVFGNSIYIGANAVIAGRIKIGNDVLIGAASLVNADVPDHCTVVGVPAIVVSQNGSKGYI